MYLEHQIVPQAPARPRSFVGLIALYESNFLRLQRLIPEIERLDGYYRSGVVGDCDLHLEILDRSRYTITLSLTYFFFDGTRRVADPDLHVRMYLDGGLAEAMSLRGRHRHIELRRLVREYRCELDARWQRNMVLNKWLDYLIEKGHLVLER
ncbi:MAG: DUF1249 domain-containing protein [Woeseiaceae bacterium]|nr:DUF1249 domain-containing protein [Woeseiaceae bacterium]